MATTLTLDGDSLTLPTANDTSWDIQLNNTITAIVNKSNEHSTTLSSVQASADNAQNAADNAQITADNAQTTADNATNTADSAANAAGLAQITADAAAPKTSAAPTILSFSLSSLAANDTTARYMAPGPVQATATEYTVTMPFAGKCSNMYVSVFGSSRNQSTFTVRKEFADTTLTCVNSVAANTKGSDLTHSFTFVAGDRIGVKVQQNTAAGTALDSCTVSFQVTLT